MVWGHRLTMLQSILGLWHQKLLSNIEIIRLKANHFQPKSLYLRHPWHKLDMRRSHAQEWRERWTKFLKEVPL